ncbi:MAG: hypothetical protein H7Z37_16135 [Pyrinomonadaceae bacterium]|nr:hypothetical protein [Pyrinomonadaceae bacterium]
MSNIFPEFDENGDLPVGIYEATLQEILERFGNGSLQRQLVSQRLKKIFRLAQSTNQLRRFIIYGSFVTDKQNPNDVDIFLVMGDDFDKKSLQGDVKRIFEHLESETDIGASIFWMLKSSVALDEKTFVEGWQIKRGRNRRGIVEVKINDSK